MLRRQLRAQSGGQPSPSVRSPIIAGGGGALFERRGPLRLQSPGLSTTTPPTPAERDFPLGEPGFHYQDLHREDRLAELDRVFLDRLAAEHPELHARLVAYRANPGSVGALDRSRLLVDAARPVGEFVARLFGVETEWRRQAASAGPEAVLFRFRRDFLMRRAVKTKLPPDLEHFDPSPLRATAGAIERELHPDLPWDADPELATAEMAVRLLDVEAEFIATIRQKKKPEISPEARAAARALAERAAASASADLPRASGNSDEELLAFLHKLLERYALWCHLRREHPVLRAGIKGWISFKLPETLDYQGLVATERPDPALPERRMGPVATHRRREGFQLTDPRMTRREILGETHYCLLCHDREKDSCSKGFFDAKTAAWQKNPLGIALKGCPLDEKISEMHQLRREGDSIGALALVAIDNPMCPGTGHRICNDCMKGCIFQKQDPVNIPQIETGVLTDVLALPWGVEIYGLLTRWNPLHPGRPSPRPYTGKKVLVVGLGPAGYTLAHYLLNEGCGVVGIDGLKIEPLPEDLTGADGGGIRPVRDWSELALPLDERAPRGIRRRVGIRHHCPLGKELSDAHPPDARPPAALHDPRRRALRRSAQRRPGLRRRLRPRRDRRGSRTPHDHPDEEQHHPRRSKGLRLPDGAPADRRLQGGGAREPPARAPRGRHRRRPDGDRHGDGAARLLPDPGRKDARPLRDALRREGRGRGSGDVRPGRAGHPRSPPRPRPGRPQGARALPRRGRDPRPRPALPRMGRRGDRVPPGHGGVPGLPAQPRRDHQGPRGGDLVRGGPRAAGGRPRRVREAEGDALSARRLRRDRRAAGAHLPRGRRDDAQHHVRQRVSGFHAARCQEALLRPAQGRALRSGLPPRGCPRRRRDGVLHGLFAGREVHHVLRRQPPRVQRQRGEGDGVGPQRLSRDRAGAERGERRARRPPRFRVGRLRAPDPRGPLGGGRRGEPSDSHDRGGRRPGAGRRPRLRAGPVLPPAEPRVFRTPTLGLAAPDRALRADGRVGGRRTGAPVDDRPGDRGLDPSLLDPQAGRAGRRDGAHRNGHRASRRARP